MTTVKQELESTDENWWQGLYDDLLAEVLLENTSDDEIHQTVEFLKSQAKVSPGARLFDQCCGTGRISLALAADGYRTIGIDQADGYIQRATEKASSAQLSENADFLTADAFVYKVQPPCEAAFNWWTSFGYQPDDEENRKMIIRAFESILPGGSFALDFMNVPGVIENFQPQVITTVQSELGEIELLRESELHLEEQMMKKRWSYRVDGSPAVVRHSAVRLYPPDQLVALFSKSGFENVRLFGDLDSSPLDVKSPRCIIVGQKPKTQPTES